MPGRTASRSSTSTDIVAAKTTDFSPSAYRRRVHVLKKERKKTEKKNRIKLVRGVIDGFKARILNPTDTSGGPIKVYVAAGEISAAFGPSPTGIEARNLFQDAVEKDVKTEIEFYEWVLGVDHFATPVAQTVFVLDDFRLASSGSDEDG